MVRCQPCGRSLTGERQKGHIYYRCHTPGCPPTSVREEEIETAIRTRFLPFAFTDAEVAEMRETLRREYERQSSVAGEQDRANALQIEAIRPRPSRLLDAYIDGTLDTTAFEERKSQRQDSSHYCAP